MTMMSNFSLCMAFAAPHAVRVYCRSAGKRLGETDRKLVAVITKLMACVVLEVSSLVEPAGAGCAVEIWTSNAGSLQPVKMWRIVRTPTFNAPFGCEASIVTICACHGTTSRLLGQLLHMNRS